MPQGLDADGRTALVRRLLSGALPGAADQPLRRLTTSGTEHDVWRIGADLVLRLPRDADAETGLRKESAWWTCNSALGRPAMKSAYAVRSPGAVVSLTGHSLTDSLRWPAAPGFGGS